MRPKRLPVRQVTEVYRTNVMRSKGKMPECPHNVSFHASIRGPQAQIGFETRSGRVAQHWWQARLCRTRAM